MTFYDELLKKYGYIKETKSGINEDGENCLISIDENCACIRTMQKNGWMRINIYHKDGTIEELFEP